MTVLLGGTLKESKKVALLDNREAAWEAAPAGPQQQTRGPPAHARDLVCV